MGAATIDIIQSIGGKEITFKFNPMTAEQTSVMIARMKSRWNSLEAIKRALEKFEGRPEIPADPTRNLAAMPAILPIPIHLRDEMEYIALQDKRDQINAELGKALRPLFETVVEPPLDELIKMIDVDENIPGMMKVFEGYFNGLFPNDGDRKKS